MGEVVYNFFNKDYKNTCWFWFAFNTAFVVAFYLGFFLWKYSDNTQEAVNRRNKLLKDQEARNNGEIKEQAKENKDKKD